MGDNNPHKSYEEVCALFEGSVQTYSDVERKNEEQVILTEEEIAQSRANKRKAKGKVKTFANSPIYRTLHESMRLLIEIVQLIPRKNIKLTDSLLQNFTETIRWTASAYHHSDTLLKVNSLEEAISLMYVIRITLNCMKNLIGEKKYKQLIASNEAVTRQLVAWRGSLTNQGPDDNTEL